MTISIDYTVLANVQKLGEIDPEYADALKKFTPRPPNPDLVAVRAERLLAEHARTELLRNDAVEMSTLMIAMRDGYMNELRIFSPTNRPARGSPLFVLFYGGGFIIGNNHQLSPYAITLVTLLGATVVLPTYRLAPENPFPAAANDAWDTLMWIYANTATLGSDPSTGFVVGGVSAGAQLAVVSAQRTVIERMTPRLTGVWACIPCLLAHQIVPESERHLFISREQNANVPGLNAKTLASIHQATRSDWASDLFSPFNSSHPHVDMPPTYFQVCGMDPLRDDALIYERVLRQNGVRTAIDVYPGVPHGHASSFPQLESSKRFFSDSVVGMAWLLGTAIDRALVARILEPVTKGL